MAGLIRLRRELSGPAWCERWPTDKTTATLEMPWRRQVQAFILAMEAAGISVSITATYRPPERAWLMHWAWKVARGEVLPELVPPRDGIPIRWAHPTREASVEAAAAMVRTYGLVYRPSLTSRHMQGHALDMDIDGWEGKTVKDGHGRRVRLETREDLYQLGASYGVMKLRSDPPHWSTDGR